MRPEYLSQKLSGQKYRMKDYPILLMIRQVLILEGFLQPLECGKRKFNIKIVIVDYLQLLSDKTAS
jgi:hypothetical protein